MLSKVSTLEIDFEKTNMKFESNVSNEVVAGVLIGGLCLSGILYLLNSTEDRAITLTYSSMLDVEQNQTR